MHLGLGECQVILVAEESIIFYLVSIQKKIQNESERKKNFN